jgi:hypothetical protein
VKKQGNSELIDSIYSVHAKDELRIFHLKKPDVPRGSHHTNSA